MLFFRKNKRQFRYHSHRRVFVALFLLVLASTVISSLLFKTIAIDGPVASVEIFSQNSDFTNGDAGAWKVTKSADWIEPGKARVTFKVESKLLSERNSLQDVIIVMDTSGSMDGERINRAKSDASDLIDNLLDDASENRVALISFNDNATIVSDFSQDKEELMRLVGSIEAGGETDYYWAYKKVEELMQDYVQEDGRDTIVLFLTDGLPTRDTPNEVGIYLSLKDNYPYMIINGIQYEMGDQFEPAIVAISDNQYHAKINTLHNILFTATLMPLKYDSFTITDYINDYYWDLADASNVSAEKGDVTVEYEGDTPKITWDIASGNFYTSDSATMTIDIELKNDYIGITDLLLPTNTHEIISSSIRNAPDENVDSNAKPILRDTHTVSYDANVPSNCEVSGTVPEAQKKSVFSAVEISENQLSCEGYNFQGWKIKTKDVTRINDGYFRMPNNDVELVAVWGAPSISKSMEGTINTRAEAVFDVGGTVNVKMRTLTGETDIIQWKVASNNTAITGIVRSATLSNTIDTNDEKYIFSAADSPVPIYGWYNDGIIYYYTDADDIYLNEDASYMFFALESLSDIRTLVNFKTSRTTSMEAMFCAFTTAITDLEPIRNWDVSNVTNMDSFLNVGANISSLDPLKDWDVSSVNNFAWMLSGEMSITNLESLSEWDTSSATTMEGMFCKQHNLTSLTGLEKWDVSNVTNMAGMFDEASDYLTNLDPLEKWKTSNVTDMSWMFYSELGFDYEGSKNYGFSNVNGLRDWDVSSVETMRGMFWGMNNLSDLSGLSDWETTSLVDAAQMFEMNSFTNVDALAGWDMSHVTNIKYTFFYVETLQNVDGLSGWDVSNVEDMGGVFTGCTGLTDISGLAEWDTGNVKIMWEMFWDATSLTNIDALEKWDVRKVETMNHMFANTVFTNVDALRKWKTTSLQDASYLFSNAKIENIGYIDEETGEATGGLSGWDMSHVTTAAYMFNFATKLKNIDGALNWHTDSLENMEWMFNEANVLKSIRGAANWNVSKVTNMGWLFDACYRIESLDPLANWNTESLEIMDNTFSNLVDITSLNGLRNWKTSKVTNMHAAIDMTRSLRSLAGLENWDVTNVTNMSWMFRGTGAENVDALANWHPNKVTDMQSMFYEARNLTDISGVSGWFNTEETSKITNIISIFDGAKITNLDALANWKTPNLVYMRYSFANNPYLTNVDGLEHWDTSKVLTVEGTFMEDTGLADPDVFSKINDWDMSSLINWTDTFLNVPDTAVLPTWWHSNPDSGD